MSQEIEKETPLYQAVRGALLNKGFLTVVQKAIPDGADFNAEQLAWVIINMIETPDDRGNFNLMNCELQSIRRAMLHCAEVGLEPGSGDCWILPRGGRANFQMGSLGYINLAMRHGARRAWAEVIYESDRFRIVRGEHPVLEHELTESIFKPGGNVDFDHKRVVPVDEGGRGRPLGTYACIENQDGSVNWSVVSEAECQQARASSKAPNSPAYSNWADEMRKRTAITRARKMWPRKALQLAAKAEESGHLSPPVEMALQSVEAQALPEARPKSGLDALVQQNKKYKPHETYVVDSGEMTEEEKAEILKEEASDV